MGDYLVKGLAADGKIRAVAVKSTETVAEAQRRHDTWPTATAALGRVLTGAALLAADLKGSQTLTLRILGNGPIGGLVAQGDAAGTVRGYVREPHVHLPPNAEGKLDVGGAVGSRGTINVTRDYGLREPYSGSAPLVSGEVADDLTHYLARSEQVPSVVALGVLVDVDGSVKSAGGFLLQVLPGGESEWAERLEANAARLTGISRLLDRGMTPEELIERGLAGFSCKCYEPQPVRFGCRCSRERAEEILATLGEGELRDMLEREGRADVRCHFCGERYRLGASELTALLEKVAAAEPRS